MLALAQPKGPSEVDMSRENSQNGQEGQHAETEMGAAAAMTNDVSPTNTQSQSFGFGPATSRWQNSGSLFHTSISPSSTLESAAPNPNGSPLPATRQSDNITPPRLHPAVEMDDGTCRDSASPFDMEMGEEQRSPLRFLPSHLQTSASRRKGKGRMDEVDPMSPITGPPGSTPHPDIDGASPKPFKGTPLPASLVATLLAEHAPLEHEIQSEARLQRFMHSHPPRLPMTPRVSKSTRGRFPEMADDDDDEEDRRLSGRARQWMGMRSDSDSESDDDGEEPVNSAFAAGMDLDRPTSMSSASSSAVWPSRNVSESGKMTPGGSGPIPGPANMTVVLNGNGQPTPPLVSTTWGGGPRPSRLSFSGMVPSPGTGFQLPGAFGGLGMGGGGTPLGSPTIERLEVCVSMMTGR